MIDINQTMREATADPSGLVIWAGAGISADSGLPMGDQLTLCLLENGFRQFNEHYLQQIQMLYQILYPDRTRDVPRLEFVLDCLALDMPPVAINTVRNLFTMGAPNSAHRWIQNLTLRGARVVTPNFDMLLEKAGCPPSKVFHYHGTNENEKQWAGILRNLAVAFDANGTIEKRLDTELAQAKYVIFLGYSGRDYYTVDPFFRERSSAYARAIWIEHEQKKNFVTGIANHKQERIKHVIGSFREAFCFSGPTWRIYGREKSFLDWKSQVEQAFKTCHPSAILHFCLTLLSRMGLGEMGLDLLKQVSHSHVWNNAGDVQQEKLEEKTVALLCLTGKYKTALVKLRQVRRQKRDWWLRNIQFRRYEQSCYIYGLLFHTWPFVLAKAVWTWLQVYTKELDERKIWLAHEQVQIIYQLIDSMRRSYIGRTQLLSRILGKARAGYEFLRMRMYQRYMENSRNLGGYDEELGHLLRGQAKRGERAHTQRFQESDELRGTAVSWRRGIMNTIRDSQPCRGVAFIKSSEITRGVIWSLSIRNYYELLDWSCLAECYVSSQRQLWQELQKRALVNMEMSRPAKRWLLRQGKKKAKFGI